MTYCEECKNLKNCELAKHEGVDTCKACEWNIKDICTVSGTKPCEVKPDTMYLGKLQK